MSTRWSKVDQQSSRDLSLLRTWLFVAEAFGTKNAEVSIYFKRFVLATFQNELMHTVGLDHYANGAQLTAYKNI